MRVLQLQTPLMRGPDVWGVQFRLVRCGFNPGKPDGSYGPKTADAVVSAKKAWGITPATEVAGALMQHSLGIRCPYLNPFARAIVTVGRIDQGVDYHGTGTILAIGDAEIIGNGGSGWPGGHYLLYKLTSGHQAGHYIFVAEAIVPLVSAGANVIAAQPIANFGPNAAPGLYPGIETGWASPVINRTLAAATTGYHEGEETAAGKAFARFLHSLGAPAPSTTVGPLYP